MRMKRDTHTLSESESPIKLQVRAKVVGTLKMSQQTGTLTSTHAVVGACYPGID